MKQFRSDKDKLTEIVLAMVIFIGLLLILVSNSNAATLSLSGTVPIKVVGPIKEQYFTNAGTEIKINTKTIGNVRLVTVKAL